MSATTHWILLIRSGSQQDSPSIGRSLLHGTVDLALAADLRSGVLHPDQLPIDVFRMGDKLISANTRSLAALSEAGLSPTVIKIKPTAQLLRRLRELPIIPNAPLPGPRVPVTPSQSKFDVLRIIELPR